MEVCIIQFDANTTYQNARPSGSTGGTRNFKLSKSAMPWLEFNEWARLYGKQGVHIIAVPRALRMAAIVSGAFVLSSNRVGREFSGYGWIVSPEGEVISSTSRDEKFVTVSIDLREAELAKRSYPRNIPE